MKKHHTFRSSIQINMLVSEVHGKYFLGLDANSRELEEFGIDVAKLNNLAERIERIINKVMSNDKKLKAI